MAFSKCIVFCKRRTFCSGFNAFSSVVKNAVNLYDNLCVVKKTCPFSITHESLAGVCSYHMWLFFKYDTCIRLWRDKMKFAKYLCPNHPHFKHDVMAWKCLVLALCGWNHQLFVRALIMLMFSLLFCQTNCSANRGVNGGWRNQDIMWRICNNMY